MARVALYCLAGGGKGTDWAEEYEKNARSFEGHPDQDLLQDYHVLSKKPGGQRRQHCMAQTRCEVASAKARPWQA